MKNNPNFDVVIIGGSYAGLSAAMALGRSLRNVLIIDNNDACNKQTPHSHNFITQDGKTPGEIALEAKKQVLNYPTIQFLEDTVIDIQKNESFTITCENTIIKADYIVLATGVKDIMPNIKGFDRCWGISVIHCPYCHGYEVKNEKTGILGNGDLAFHYAKLLTNLTKELVIFTNGKANFTTEQFEKLNQYNIEIVEKEVVEIKHQNGQLNAILFKDQSNYNINVIYASFGVTQKTNFAENLGCEITDKGLIKVDTTQKTTIDKVFACGDNSSPFRSVANAVSSGNIAGMLLNNTLIDQKF